MFLSDYSWYVTKEPSSKQLAATISWSGFERRSSLSASWLYILLRFYTMAWLTWWGNLQCLSKLVESFLPPTTVIHAGADSADCFEWMCCSSGQIVPLISGLGDWDYQLRCGVDKDIWLHLDPSKDYGFDFLILSIWDKSKMLKLDMFSWHGQIHFLLISKDMCLNNNTYFSLKGH